MAPKKPLVKTKGTPRPIITEPKLLICHEKHGDLYFHVKDDAALFKIALDILMKRLCGDWYCDPQNDLLPKNPGLTKEQADALPEGPIRDQAQKTVARYQEVLHRHQCEVDDWNELQRAVKEKDGRLAWKVLRNHNDGEYERITLEPYRESY